jgi:poly(3-hydroxybutyrate) depolymerase
MDASYYLETIQTVFQDFKLVNGTWDVRNPQGKTERVRPQDITTTALLSVEGELDDISGSGQTEAVHGLCPGVPKALHKHFEAQGAGHYGIFAGKRWRDMVYPVVKEFILAHRGQAASASAPATTSKAAPAKTAAKTATQAATQPLSKPANKAVAKTTAPIKTSWVKK